MTDEWYAHVQKLRDKMERCSYASRYKGLREPNCNKGNPCRTCLAKYRSVRKSRPKHITLESWAARQDVRIRKQARVLAKELRKEDQAVKNIKYNKADKFGRSASEKKKQAASIARIYKFAKLAREMGDVQDFRAHYRDFVEETALVRPPFITTKGPTDKLMLASIGISSEGGEQLDIIKKVFWHDRTGHKPMRADRREKLLLELGDVLWYYTVMLGCLGVTMEEVMQLNMDKLVGRDYK